MERRLILHEKFQSLTQKKISIKQGDVMVTLNLKTDLANPNIEIADKALFMLESFVEKNADKTKPHPSPALPATSLSVDTANASISKSVSKSNFRSKEKLLISPSKRVRFDLITPEPIESSQNLFVDENVVTKSQEDGLDNLESSTNRSEDETEEDVITSTPNMPENNKNQPFKKCIDDYLKTESSRTPDDYNNKSLESTLSPCNSTHAETLVEVSQSDKNITKEEIVKKINTDACETQLYPIFKTSKRNSSNSSSNSNSTNSSNNTLDELLEELDKSNSKLIQQTDKISQEMGLDESFHEISEINSTKTDLNAHTSANILDKEEVDLLNKTPMKIPHEASFSYIKHCELNNTESAEVFKCRLCHLKLNSQRSLHEHVARIHGGKGGLFNSSLFPNTMSNEEQEGETFNENEFDSDLELISKFNSKGSGFKKKFTNDFMPHPNVAIRVAKIAYYNSKLSTGSSSSEVGGSANNAFKANIFTNGMRGNFFSQERLPLRSCKIKMKLRKQSDCKKNDPRSFLTFVNELSSAKSIDRNTTLTVQSSKLNTDEEVTVAEIRQFFKSLLVYLPISNVMRLNDLIKANETDLKSATEDLSGCLKIIYELIIDSKQIGITLYELKKAFDLKSSILCDRMIKFVSLIQLLVDNFLVLKVGVVDRVFVAYEFKQHWVIHSFKNQKGRGDLDSLYKDDNLSVETEVEEEDKEIFSNENDSENENNISFKKDLKISPTRASLRNKSVPAKYSESVLNSTSSNKSKQFKPVCLVPRPWRYIDGHLNRTVLQKMLETILIYLKTYPNSSLESISQHFCPVLQPIMTLELLEMLEKLRLVKVTMLSREGKSTLFSDFQNGSSRLDDWNLACGNETCTYLCTQNSIFLIKTLFAK